MSAPAAPPAAGVARALWRVASDLPAAARVRRSLALRFLEAICQAIPVGVVAVAVGDLERGDIDAARAWVYAATCVLALLGQVVLRRLAYGDAWVGGTQLGCELKLRLLDRLRELPMSYHARHRAGDTTTIITQDMFQVNMFLCESLPAIGGAIGLCAVLLAVLLVVDAPLACACLISIAAALPVLRHTQRTFRRLAAERQRLGAVATSRVVEFVQGIAVVRAFGQGDAADRRLRAALDDFRAINRRLAVRLAPLYGAFEAVLGLGVAVVVAAVSYRLFGGRIDEGTALVFLVVVLRVYDPVIELNGTMERLRMAEASLGRIRAVLDAPTQPEPNQPTARRGDHVEFDRVSFAYTPGTPVLADVSFAAQARSLTALVGHSGAGKTTVLNLVARLWDPDCGSVRIGDVDVRDLGTEQLFDAISVVFQDVYLFNTTIFDNIAFGRSDAAPDAVYAAARAACCHDFVAELSDGYDTIIGEGGKTLSGGERQRISIARAILKDSPIVLLDEATAAIDPINEKLIQRALTALAAERTLIVIAHRLSTIRGADQIVVLDRGRVVQQGTHDELILLSGTYARFWAERERAAGWRLQAAARPGGA